MVMMRMMMMIVMIVDGEDDDSDDDSDEDDDSDGDDIHIQNTKNMSLERNAYKAVTVHNSYSGGCRITVYVLLEMWLSPLFLRSIMVLILQTSE